MGDYMRLITYLQDQFPDPNTSEKEIHDWAKQNVRSWKKMPKESRQTIVEDWREYLIDEQVEKEFVDVKPSLLMRIKSFIRVLLRRRER